MVKIFLWILKFFAFGLFVGVATLFLMPYVLTPTEEQKNGPEINIRPVSLVCTSMPIKEASTVDDKMVLEHYGLEKSNVNVSKSLRQIAECRILMKNQSQSIDNCFCLNDYYVFITLVSAGACTIQYGFGMIILCASRVEVGVISKRQGCTMCFIGMFNCVIWAGNGVLQLLHKMFFWPLTYEKPGSTTTVHYYHVPETWDIGTYLCFGSSFFCLLEAIIWIWTAARKRNSGSSRSVRKSK